MQVGWFPPVDRSNIPPRSFRSTVKDVSYYIGVHKYYAPRCLKQNGRVVRYVIGSCDSITASCEPLCLSHIYRTTSQISAHLSATWCFGALAFSFCASPLLFPAPSFQIVNLTTIGVDLHTASSGWTIWDRHIGPLKIKVLTVDILRGDGSVFFVG